MTISKKKYLYLFTILFTLLFVSCSTIPQENSPSLTSTPEITKQTSIPSTQITTTPTTENKQNPYKIQAQFDLFTDAIFVDEVTKDSLTLNYTLAHPENFGIKPITPTLGSFGINAMKKDLAVSNTYLSKLQSFHREQLSESQQLTYDILSYLLAPNEQPEEYFYYNEILSPTTGIQAQLPVLFAEFRFYSKEDITTYLKLLKTVPEYFSQIITFEEEKSNEGLFMSDDCADAIIEQCKDFIEKPEKNLLLEIFNEKLDSLSLNKNEKEQYGLENKEAVLNYVIPAYESLIKTLTSLKGTGKNNGGLCNFPKGKDYYMSLVQSNTGSSRSIEDIDLLLDNTIQSSMQTIYEIAANDSKALDNAIDVKYKLTDPIEIISYLKKNIKKDFPDLDAVNCSIKYVHPSLEENLSPAFYLTPPIDNYLENSIYINGNKKYDLSSIFTTIAHEGYPGHLYQTVYYHQKNPSLIRSVIDIGGYTEGWATYVELYSYQLAGFDKTVATILQNNLIATLCVYAKVDMGVNYYGWDLEKTKQFLKEFDITSEEDIHTMYHAMIEDPSNYMKYTLGYLEFISLRDKAKKELRNSFVLKEFHTFLLDIGPAPFDIIDAYLDQWILTKKKGSPSPVPTKQY